MDKNDNQLNYFNHMFEIKNKLQLTLQLIQEFQKQPNLNQFMTGYWHYTDDESRKMYLLALAIPSRFACQSVVNALLRAGQVEVAEMIAKHNVSPGPWPLTYEPNLVVSYCLHPKVNMSNCYESSRPIRGRCVIINTMEEPESPDSIGLANETIRFEKVFLGLNFQVIKVSSEANCKRIMNELKQFSEKDVAAEDEAFVLIMISHGSDNKILGYDACDALRLWYSGKTVDRNWVAKTVDQDIIDIKDIYSVFAECPKLKSKPKMFFFICCRDKELSPTNGSGDTVFKSEEKLKPPSVNSDTYVCYSCAKGYKTFYHPREGYTYFGLVLTQTIAQYACEESLNQIMSRTYKRLDNLHKELDEHELKTYPEGSFSPEHRAMKMKHEVYFNPGYIQI